MDYSFIEFDEYLQIFIFEMNNFNYFIACKIWPEPNFNNLGNNHFWDKFLESDKDFTSFYSRLDPCNRKKLYDHIMKSVDQGMSNSSNP